MHQMYKTISPALAGMLLGVLLGGIQNVHAELTVQSGFDYTSGDYGASEKTRIVYIPLTVRSESERLMFQVTAPYIRVDAPAAGQTIIGPGGIPIQTGTDGRESNSGLGDVVTAARYTLLDGSASGLLLDATGKIKLGTADESQGLGTGENDYSLQLDGAQVLDRGFTLFATMGYRIYGDPPGVEFDNVFFGSLGGIYKLFPDTSGGLVYDFRERITPRSDSQRELTAFMTHRIDKSTKVQGYVVRGFSDSSPDWGGGLLFSFGL